MSHLPGFSRWNHDESSIDSEDEAMYSAILNPYLELGGDNKVSNFNNISWTASVFVILKHNLRLAMITGTHINWHGLDINVMKNTFDIFLVYECTNNFIQEEIFKFVKEENTYFTFLNNFDIIELKNVPSVILNWNFKDFRNINILSKQFFKQCTEYACCAKRSVDLRLNDKYLKQTKDVITWTHKQHCAYIKYQISGGGGKYGVISIKFSFVPMIYFTNFFLKCRNKYFGYQKFIIKKSKGLYGLYSTKDGHLPNQLFYNIYNSKQSFNELGNNNIKHRIKQNGIVMKYNPLYGNLYFKINIESKFPGSQGWQSVNVNNENANIVYSNNAPINGINNQKDSYIFKHPQTNEIASGVWL